jgi:Leucine-rich repeat (LRR) protein
MADSTPDQIKSLDLFGKYLKEANLAQALAEFKLDNLKSLNPSNNEFKSIPSEILSTLLTLVELNLTGNKITEIDKNSQVNLPRLQTLHLKKNKITSTSAGAFKNSSELSFLGLRENSISNLTPAMFEGLNKLQELNLEYNYIEANPLSGETRTNFYWAMRADRSVIHHRKGRGCTI